MTQFKNQSFTLSRLLLGVSVLLFVMMMQPRLVFAVDEVDLAVSISESADPVVEGSNGGNDNLVHTVTVTNNGPATATNIEIQFGANTLQAPTLSFSTGDNFPGGNVWDFLSLAPGDSETMTLTWDVGEGYSDSNPISSSAFVQAVDQTDTDSSNDSASEGTTVQYLDEDGDGVLYTDDLCAGTDLINDAPPSPKKNRFYVNADGDFVDGKGNLSGYTIADTGGCSSQQIIEVAGLGDGHTRFGISRSALEAWIASVP